eukprot:Nk52_evm9s2496 gene=Nk52_evmTU9s2496
MTKDQVRDAVEESLVHGKYAPLPGSRLAAKQTARLAGGYKSTGGGIAAGGKAKKNVDKQLQQQRPNQLTGPRGMSKGKIGQMGRRVYVTTLSDLPSELVIRIFEFLAPWDLLQCQFVCSRLYEISSDAFLWKTHFIKYREKKKKSKGSSKKSSGHRLGSGELNWKKAYIQELFHCNHHRMMGTRQDPYTCLTVSKSSIEKARVCCKLAITTKDGKRVRFVKELGSDGVLARMSGSLTWATSRFPSIEQVKTIEIYAMLPLVVGEESQGNKNGTGLKKEAALKVTAPVTKAPMKEVLFAKADFSKTPFEKWLCSQNSKGKPGEGKKVTEDSVVELFRLVSQLYLARWVKESSSTSTGSEISFISFFFNYSDLQRCLNWRHKCLTPFYKAPIDDLDPAYGLHSYSAVIEMRSEAFSAPQRKRVSRFAKGPCSVNQSSTALCSDISSCVVWENSWRGLDFQSRSDFYRIPTVEDPTSGSYAAANNSKVFDGHFPFVLFNHSHKRNISTRETLQSPLMLSWSSTRDSALWNGTFRNACVINFLMNDENNNPLLAFSGPVQFHATASNGADSIDYPTSCYDHYEGHYWTEDEGDYDAANDPNATRTKSTSGNLTRQRDLVANIRGSGVVIYLVHERENDKWEVVKCYAYIHSHRVQKVFGARYSRK